MNNLRTFVTQSQTFSGFMFSGNFDVYEDFLKMYDIYLLEGVNILDDYSRYIYLTWIKYGDAYIYDYDACNIYDESISVLRKYKIVDSDLLSEQRGKLKYLRDKYKSYLESKSQQPRIKACSYTSKKDVRIAVFELYGNKCLCCGTEEKITIDHVVPVKKGGVNELSNMQPLCKSCNSRKSTSTTDYR